MYLVLIETSGNQRYIFSTNKLKENVGASELTYRAGITWVLEAIDSNLTHFSNSQNLRTQLLNQSCNPSIETNSAANAVEIVVATSGKTLLLVNQRDRAKDIIQQVTLKALKDAPGLDVCGVISEEFDWQKDHLWNVNNKIHDEFQDVRSRRLPPDLRFLRLPVVADCATSGLPANQIDRDPNSKIVLRSAVSWSKRQETITDRINTLVKPQYPAFDLAQSIRQLNTETEDNQNPPDWLAVVHADGNGLGEIFLKFHDHLRRVEGITLNNRSYVNALRQFSAALDVCTENAFLNAIAAFLPSDAARSQPASDQLIPVIPLILGGDDLTVVCDGRAALRFTQRFLTAFEAETQQTDATHYEGIIAKIARQALGCDRLSACAGVAIIKPHFPFSVAYDLAEALTKSAKQVKEIVQVQDRGDTTNPCETVNHPQITHTTQNKSKSYPCSALDFQVVYDSSGVELHQIRSRLAVDQQDTQPTKLYTRPYVTTLINQLPQTVSGREWVQLHRWQKLENRIFALKDTKDDGSRKLPNSQIHDLRAGLTLGRKLADARYHLIRDRYLEENITELESSSGSLFMENQNNERNRDSFITGLLDAIEAAEFLQDAQHTND